MAPRPKSPETRRLHGSKERPRHRRQAVTVAPPIVDDGPIVPPTDLGAAERRYWRQFAPLLASARLLTAADRESLADYCRACAHVADRVARTRRELRTSRADAARLRLFDSQARQWMAHKIKLATVLGLTASSRARLGWTGQRAPSAPSSPANSDAPRPPSKLAELQHRAAQLRLAAPAHGTDDGA